MSDPCPVLVYLHVLREKLEKAADRVQTPNADFNEGYEAAMRDVVEQLDKVLETPENN